MDAILDRAIVVFNVIQNPDGRVAGTRANGNGFDLNRDFLTQSQSETKASVRIMQEWLPPETLDLHGYVHADADRGDDEAAQPGHRLRPLAEVEPVAHRCERGCDERGQPQRHTTGQRLVLRRQRLGAGSQSARTASRPARQSRRAGTTGPVLHAHVLQLVGLNGSTVEMCSSTNTGTNPLNRCYLNADPTRRRTRSGGTHRCWRS